jgi:hypothetical protein
MGKFYRHMIQREASPAVSCLDGQAGNLSRVGFSPTPLPRPRRRPESVRDDAEFEIAAFLFFESRAARAACVVVDVAEKDHYRFFPL